MRVNIWSLDDKLLGISVENAEYVANGIRMEEVRMEEGPRARCYGRKRGRNRLLHQPRVINKKIYFRCFPQAQHVRVSKYPMQSRCTRNTTHQQAWILAFGFVSLMAPIHSAECWSHSI